MDKMEQKKTYRIHYFGKGEKRGKKTVVNDFENIAAYSSDEARQKALESGKKVKEIYGISHLHVDVHELSFVTYFELDEAN